MLSKKVNLSPQEHVYQGPPYAVYKNSENIESELCFKGGKQKCDKKKPSGTRLAGVPPSTVYKKFKNIENELCF